MSLQEQLHDLKAVMEKMSERDELDSTTLPTTTAPSTPGVTPADRMNKLFEAANLTPNTPGSDDVTPEHPLHFHHLIHPVLRTDLAAFKDFEEMLKISTRSAPSSRVSSGNYSSLNVLGLGSLTNNSTTSLPTNGRSPSIGNSSPRDSISSTTSATTLCCLALVDGNRKSQWSHRRKLSDVRTPRGHDSSVSQIRIMQA